MTIDKVLAQVDELKPNQYSDQIKILWLEELDRNILEDIILTHEHEDIVFTGYSEETMQEELLVPDPYSEIYRLYIMAQIDFANGETDRYNNSMLMYNAAYDNFVSWYNRTHLPLAQPLVLF